MKTKEKNLRQDQMKNEWVEGNLWSSAKKNFEQTSHTSHETVNNIRVTLYNSPVGKEIKSKKKRNIYNNLCLAAQQQVEGIKKNSKNKNITMWKRNGD